MLTKNVYITYRPGYSGSYVNWAINISDLDLFDTTVKDPINKSKSTLLGGTGTAHLHHRIPTHQNYDAHLAWVIKNKPAEPRIYILNMGRDNSQHIAHLLTCDGDGVVININHGNDPLVKTYAEINAVTKWPTYFKVHELKNNFHPPVPVAESKDSLAFRNYIVSNYNQLTNSVFNGTPPLYWDHLENFVKLHTDWVKLRTEDQPHEMIEGHYVTSTDLTRVFDINVMDVVSSKFPGILNEILSKSNASDNFSTKYLEEFHKHYIDAQPNLQWFASIAKLNSTRVLDEYLLSHSFIQASVLLYLSATHALPDNWEAMSTNDITDLIWAQR